jgi:hypothetical protein
VTDIQRFLLAMADLQTRFDKKSDPGNRRTLRQSFILLCDSMYNIVQKRPDEAAERFSSAYALLLKCRAASDLDGLSKDTPLSPQQSIVHLFQRVLGHFHQVALNKVVRKERAQRPHKGQTRRSAIAIGSSVDPEQECGKQLTALARVLIIMFTEMGQPLEHPDKLLQNLLSLLLDHIGSILSFFIFANPADHADTVAPVTGIFDTIGLDHSSVVETGQLSAPYLVGILRAALHACLRGGQATSASSSWRDAPASLSKEVQEKLQKTLVRGMFGDQDEFLKGAFAAPEVLNEEDFQRIVSEAQNANDDTPWFVGQIWQLLGWDILSKRSHPLKARH